jgi:S1-C subfamily serine protease
MNSRAVAMFCLLAAAGAGLVSCSGHHSKQSRSPSSDQTDQTDQTDTGGGSAGGCAASNPGAKAVEKCLSPSVAFVSTDEASGSGVLLDNGFLLTNAHVVDPFTKADVIFPDGDKQVGVPVKGVDLQADMALLGPIKGDHPGVTLGDPKGLEKGDDLFLVGYPGGASTDQAPDVTIAKGVLSRTRSDDRFNLHFVQTDAVIAGGQSGGALTDKTGRVVGISGYDLDNFALALTGPDAQVAADNIAKGRGDPYGELDKLKPAATGSFAVTDKLRPQVLFVPVGPARTLHLQLSSPESVVVGVSDFGGNPIFVEDRLQFFLTATPPLSADGIDPSTVKPRSGPGIYDIKLDAGFNVLLAVYSTAPGPTPIAYTASEPIGVAADTDDSATIKVGDKRDGILGFLETGDDYAIDLTAGQTIDIFAGSAVGDVAYLVRAADGSGQPVEVDDSGEGIFGQDAHDTFTAPTAGRYMITVEPSEPFTIAYRLEVKAAGKSTGSDNSDNTDPTAIKAPIAPGLGA